MPHNPTISYVSTDPMVLISLRAVLYTEIKSFYSIPRHTDALCLSTGARPDRKLLVSTRLAYTPLRTYNEYISSLCRSNFSTFANVSVRAQHFSAKTQMLEDMNPAEHMGPGLGAIRSLWSAWQALKGFFPAGVNKTISLVSIREALFRTRVNVGISLFLYVLVVPSAMVFCVRTQHTTQTTDNSLQQQSSERG